MGSRVKGYVISRYFNEFDGNNASLVILNIEDWSCKCAAYEACREEKTADLGFH
jgi:hypothetical protein